MKRVTLLVFLLLITMTTSCLAVSWEMLVSDDKTTPTQDAWYIDTDSIVQLRPNYIEAALMLELNPPAVLPGDKKATLKMFHHIGFTRTKQICIMQTEQRFNDKSKVNGKYECNFADIEPYSAADFAWRYLFGAR